MPHTVTFTDGSTITYSYAADETKLRTVHTINGTTTQKDYCGNVVYENGIQKILLTEEGYVDLSASTPTYYYYLKDHQGNNRVVIDKDGAVKETNHYYPFGGLFDSDNEQPYKYNGKELDTKKGLNWYDYDASLGRWFVADPLAEKMSSWSPYSYCFNNPVKFVDKNGMAPGPGDLFTTPRSAAKDWGWYYNGASIVRKREMGSSIYEVKKGKSLIGYSYTPATVGNAHGTGFSKPQNGENIVATIHSHGNYDGKIKTEDGSVGLVKDNEHSTADKSYNIQNETIGYLATPNGSLLEHNPKTGEIIVVTEKLPSDSNDPSRKNRTSATESSREVPFIEKIKDWIINFINN